MPDGTQPPVTESELSFEEAPAAGFELWNVMDGQGCRLGQLAYMPERRNRDQSRYEGGDHWWLSVNWTEKGPVGDRHCLSTAFYPTREGAIAALLGFFNHSEGGDPA